MRGTQPIIKGRVGGGVLTREGGRCVEASNGSTPQSKKRMYWGALILRNKAVAK